MRENKFQSVLIKELEDRFPGCMIFITDPRHLQGSPDLLILFNDRWAALEVKRSHRSPKQPNQKYYIDKMKGMSYAAFIYPSNKEEVLDELQRAFTS